MTDSAISGAVGLLCLADPGRAAVERVDGRFGGGVNRGEETRDPELGGAVVAAEVAAVDTDVSFAGADFAGARVAARLLGDATVGAAAACAADPAAGDAVTADFARGLGDVAADFVDFSVLAVAGSVLDLRAGGRRCVPDRAAEELPPGPRRAGVVGSDSASTCTTYQRSQASETQSVLPSRNDNGLPNFGCHPGSLGKV